MSKIFYKIPYFLSICALLIISSCTTYSTSYNERQPIDLEDINNVKKGEACTKNLFGGIDFPLIGNVAVKLSGEQSVIDALKNGNITDVYSVDRSTEHYLLYSKKCTIVYGK
ncbi:TRL-like family protein [Rickettsiales bacterium]|nr:TRL-like family protein [Rickettsiales bacterium]